MLKDKKSVHILLSYGGKILKGISEKIGKKKIRIIAYNEEPRRFLEDLFAPAPVLTINTIWIPDGSKETKVVIPAKDMRKLPADKEVLKDLAKKIQNITLRIEFEKSQ